MQIETLLAERGRTHGDFTHHARVTQELKALAASGPMPTACRMSSVRVWT